jgi:dTDP-glucose 4,6-dehydratase
MSSIIIPYDPVAQEDIEYTCSHFDFSPLYNSSLLITGSSGLIGSQIIKTLIYLNYKENARIKIYALSRNAKKMMKIFGDSFRDIHYIENDITNKIDINDTIDFIIHGASITSSKLFIEKPVETINTAFCGTMNMLNFALNKKVKSFVYLSSMEIYGATSPSSGEIKETHYGYIDILNPRSSYSESKRMCECLCSCFAKEYSLPVKIARLGQVIGPGTDKEDARSPSQFSWCVIKNENIILKTTGETLRPSIYTRDVIIGIFILLIKGKNAGAYNLANKNTAVSISDTAKMIANTIGNNSIEVLFKLDEHTGYAPDLYLKLNTDKIESLGWKAEIDLEESYRRMIQSLRYRFLSNNKPEQTGETT